MFSLRYKANFLNDFVTSASCVPDAGIKILKDAKIIHSMRPAERKDRSIDLNMCISRNIPFV